MIGTCGSEGGVPRGRGTVVKFSVVVRRVRMIWVTASAMRVSVVN
jgi:hypothetical protein